MKFRILATVMLLLSAAALADGPPSNAAAATAPAPAVAPSPPVAPSPAPKPKAASSQTRDRLDLDTTTITGNRELPKVMYVVPWKRADIGDLSGRPANSLLDEVLAPVDRDVFRRQLSYFNEIDPDRPGRDAAAAAPDPAH